MKMDLTRRDFVKLAGVGTSLAPAPGCIEACHSAFFGNVYDHGAPKKDACKSRALL
ncbi:MAG: twin-arginine translocation signal domain-containing protein [Planctomycetes bacterium]|nr:twin-arginine translocation signal domain-containing protein [Planctomycetota bacterium]